MSATVFSSPSAVLPPRRPDTPGQQGAPSAQTAARGLHPHRLADALRAIRVYVSSAFEVAILGEYAEGAGTAGIRRR